MLAYHPVTGKEIRIIQSDASIWKERKTLAVGSDKGIWDTVSFDANENAMFSIALGHIEPEELVVRCKQSRLVFLQKEQNQEINADLLRTLGIQNMICLEEMKDLYPHLGPSWDGTADDAVVLIAGLLRYRYIARSKLTDRAASLDIRYETSANPAPLWWVTQYFQAEKGKRKREIDLCLEQNVASERINNILLLNEQIEHLPPLATKAEENGRLTQRVIGHRLTYADVLEAANSLPDNAILAFANADICIDDQTWKQLWSVDLTNRCLALLRWDVPSSGKFEDSVLFGPRADSQDTWVMRVADIKAASARGAFKTITGIPFGKMGCDNAFALEIFRAKFAVINPARTLKTYHVHNSAIRNYDVKDVVERPTFLYIHPTGFHDLEPLVNRWPVKTILKSDTTLDLTRRLEGSGAQAWMEVVNHRLAIGDTPWTRNGVHTLKRAPEVVLQLQNVWQTEEGLCYDQEHMYIGAATAAQRVWGEASLRSLSPSLVSKDAAIVPFHPTTMMEREAYVLKYLSKVIRLRRLANRFTPEFLCPESKEFVDTLHMFDWGTERMPVIKYEKDQQIWCESALMTPVSDNAHVLPEDIASLREAVRGWKETPIQPYTLVIVEDGEVFTTEAVRKIEEALENKWNIRVVYPGRTSAERWWDVMRGAWGIVMAGDVKGWGWNWLLPKGAYVFEVNSSSADALNLSAAAELSHRFVKNWKDVQKEIETTYSVTEQSSEPILWLPRKDLEGFFAHSGDSFREMAKIWDERGYIQVKEHPTATMCWWGSVGDVLLYDRPTHEWRLAASAAANGAAQAEGEYKAALYGNPKPPEGVSNAHPWFFWPRRPSLVEDLVHAGAINKSWVERKEGAVFYGKIENKVQEKRRTGAKQPDWSKACDEWVMIKGAETKYPFTQKEYLERLASARFGLCLPGYGWKCHREVECMAMGCVPLVAPDVDMESYANPPVQGVHYLRVSTPEEAVEITKGMSRESWEKMSSACKSWWKTNASAEGSFQLTKKLCEK